MIPSRQVKGPLDFATLSFNTQYKCSEEDLGMKTKLGTSGNKYKFELGGMLVYDSKALMGVGNEVNELKLKEPSDDKASAGTGVKEVIKSGNSDYLAFLRMKHHKPDPEFNADYILELPKDGVTLLFNSKFESGNLHKAVKISDYEYMLYLHTDTNTSDQNHWYYFNVKNPRKTSINFKITNMIKRDPLYELGMKPCVYSKLSFEKNGLRWHREGYNVTYTENVNDIKGLNFIGSRKYYTLSFTYDFRYEGDEVSFAYALPYTHTQLSLYINDLKNRYPSIVRANPLCRTLAGNLCEFLTITSNIKSYLPYEEEAFSWSVSSNTRKLTKLKTMKKEAQEKTLGKHKPSKHEHKKGIVLTARVHSGETVSSYMLLGAIDFLIGSSPAAKILRKNFVFKVVPMLNPDGCKYGNYRCSLLGVDLNRRWTFPNKSLHPTIYYTKKMIESFSEKHEVMMICDMHGHTKRRNVFMYGCGVNSLDTVDIRRNLLARVVPYLMSLRNKLFSFKDSHFRMESDRKATARVVMWESLGISHCYTMEASFYGPSKLTAFSSDRNDLHMTEDDLKTLGADLCKTCLIFCNKPLYMKKIQVTNEYLRQLLALRCAKLNRRIINKHHKKSANLNERDSNDKVAKVKAMKHKKMKEEATNKVKEVSLVTKEIEIEEVREADGEMIIEEEKEVFKICEQEALWEEIQVVKLEPDRDTGGSESDCSLVDEPTDTLDVILSSNGYKKQFEPKKKQSHTPVPFPSQLTKKKHSESPFDISALGKHTTSIPSPKTTNMKKGAALAESPLVPQVFLFPEENIHRPLEGLSALQRFKESQHLKEPKTIYDIPKKVYKLRSRITCGNSCDKYPDYFDRKSREENVRNSLDNDKIFAKITTHKVLNEFFSTQTGKNNVHSMATSSKYRKNAF